VIGVDTHPRARYRAENDAVHHRAHPVCRRGLSALFPPFSIDILALSRPTYRVRMNRPRETSGDAEGRSNTAASDLCQKPRRAEGAGFRLGPDHTIAIVSTVKPRGTGTLGTPGASYTTGPAGEQNFRQLTF
jgi:hypothetical protein